MKPEYIGIGNFDTMNYVYAYCKCPLPVDYAIKWPLIKDGKPHSYTCTCENCGTTVSTIAKSFGPEVYKEMEMEATMKAIKAIKTSKQPYDEFGFFDPFSIKEKESNDYAVSIQEVHEAVTKWAGSENVLAARLTSEVRSLLDSIHSLQPVTPRPKMGRWIKKEYEICFSCNNCLVTNASGTKYNYCPNCGAKMREEV